MADIIRLRGSPHEQTQALLPWYVNHTLEAEEAALVDEHLSDCAECRADLELERGLARQVAKLPLDAERGWTAMQGRIDAAPAPGRFGAPVSFLRRRIALGWAVAGQLAAAAAVLAIFASQPSVPGGEIYRALGADAEPQSGNMVVLFNPAASEKDIRSALLRLDARLIDGPTAGGAYVLQVTEARRAEALAALRKSDQILLAEPIDLEATR